MTENHNPPPQPNVAADKYGYVVEVRGGAAGLFVTRSRVHGSVSGAKVCVDAWRKLYTEDHWRFDIVPIYASAALATTEGKANG